jgi:CheY-like chemotaxis protein
VEAVEAVRRQRYDVVLMDVQMPEMDGLEATRHIHDECVAGERPRIVAMTANAMAGDREECLAAGMDDYLAKPIDLTALAAALERTGAAAGDGQVIGDGGDALPVFDPGPIDDLLEAMGAGGPELVRTLVATFLEEAPRLLAVAAEAQAAGRVDEVKRSAHSLKSSSAALGAMGLSAACRRLEAAAAAAEAGLDILIHAAQGAFVEVRPMLELRLPVADR